jgi:hypothetical protein
MGKTGPLIFKGEKKVKKRMNKKRKRGKEEEAEEVDGETPTIQNAIVADQIIDKNNENASSSDKIQGSTTTISSSNHNNCNSQSNTTTPSIIRKGTGKITTSSTVLTGHGTKFQKELAVGDAILACIDINNSNSPEHEELRVITMLLSDTSLNLSSAFSKSLKQPQSFRYICKPKHVQQQQDQQDAMKKKLEQEREMERSAFDLYSSVSGETGKNIKNILVYREKTETGSYRIQRQKLPDQCSAQQHQQHQQPPSRGDLLDLRSKKTSDKYC